MDADQGDLLAFAGMVGWGLLASVCGNMMDILRPVTLWPGVRELRQGA